MKFMFILLQLFWVVYAYQCGVSSDIEAEERIMSYLAVRGDVATRSIHNLPNSSVLSTVSYARISEPPRRLQTYI